MNNGHKRKIRYGIVYTEQFQLYARVHTQQKYGRKDTKRL